MVRIRFSVLKIINELSLLKIRYKFYDNNPAVLLGIAGLLDFINF